MTASYPSPEVRSERPTRTRTRTGGGGSPTASRSQESVPSKEGRRASASPVTASSPPPSHPTQGTGNEQETWSDRVYAALPLFVVGGLCFSIAASIHSTGTATGSVGNGSVHLQLWILFVALGITGIGGGTVAMLAEDTIDETARAERAPSAEPTQGPPNRKPRWLFGRSREERPGRSPLTSTTHPQSPSASFIEARIAAGSRPSRLPPTPPPWDESVIEWEEHRPVRGDSWDLNSNAFRAAAFDSSSPDVILRELDELEQSLQKRAGTRRQS